MTKNTHGIMIDSDEFYVMQSVTDEQDQHIATEWQEMKRFLDQVVDKQKILTPKKTFELKSYGVKCKMCEKADLVEKKREISHPFHFRGEEITHVCPKCTGLKNKYLIAFNPAQSTTYRVMIAET